MMRMKIMRRRCHSCDALHRLNDRYRDTIERLATERDQSRELERVLLELLRDAVTEDDVGRTSLG